MYEWQDSVKESARSRLVLARPSLAQGEESFGCLDSVPVSVGGSVVVVGWGRVLGSHSEWEEELSIGCEEHAGEDEEGEEDSGNHDDWKLRGLDEEPDDRRGLI